MEFGTPLIFWNNSGNRLNFQMSFYPYFLLKFYVEFRYIDIAHICIFILNFLFAKVLKSSPCPTGALKAISLIVYARCTSTFQKTII